MFALRELCVGFGLVVREEWLQLGTSGMVQVLVNDLCTGYIICNVACVEIQTWRMREFLRFY